GNAAIPTLEAYMPAAPTSVVWRSYDHNVARIESNGLAAGIAPGTTTIEAVDVRGTPSFDTSIANVSATCTTPGLVCEPAFATSIGTGGLLQVQFTSSPTSCAPVMIHF